MRPLPQTPPVALATASPADAPATETVPEVDAVPALYRDADETGATRTMTFVAHTDSVRPARHWATAAAEHAGAAACTMSTLALLATEAITNAVLHAVPGGEIVMSVTRLTAGVRISTRDESDDVPVLKHVPATALGGRGVMLIDRLSTAWGVELHDEGGKTVWFDVTV